MSKKGPAKLRAFLESMEGTNWATGERLAPAAPRSRSGAAAAEAAGAPARRSRSRSRSVSPRHPRPKYTKKHGWVIEGLNGKLHRTRVWNEAGVYGGPYSNPMNLLKSKRFRADQKDIFGKRWVSEFAKERAFEDIEAKVANPKKGDVIYDPEDPDNLEKILMYDGDDWIRPINAHGEHGGPYLDEREARRNPDYVAHQAKAAAAAAAAAGVSVADKVFDEHIEMVPAGKRAEARAEGYAKFTAAVASAAASDPALLSDEVKLAARARRALKGFLPEAAAPAPRQKAAKKGGGRTRKGTRKGRRGSRKH
jgi:hypothetical protein